MQNKKMLMFVVLGVVAMMGRVNAAPEQVVDIEVEMEQVAADAIDNYQVEGSLFQQITDLEQEKILMQLEKERAQLDLELDRLAAEKIKLHMEIDTLSGRAEQQQQEIETQKAKLEAEAARIEKEKESWLAEIEEKKAVSKPVVNASAPAVEMDIAKMYRLVSVAGAGSQLQATVADLTSGQTKRIGVGKSLNGFKVKSISLDDGVEFIGPVGEVQNLNVSNGK